MAFIAVGMRSLNKGVNPALIIALLVACAWMFAATSYCTGRQQLDGGLDGVHRSGEIEELQLERMMLPDGRMVDAKSSEQGV